MHAFIKHRRLKKLAATLLYLTAAAYSFCVVGCDGLFHTRAVPDEPDRLTNQATRIVMNGLNDADPAVRASAVEVVATTKTISLMPSVSRLLADEFVPVRFNATLAVADTRYTLAKNPVRKLLNDPDRNVAAAAAYCLAMLGSDEHIGIVKKAAESSDQTLRSNAALLLGKLGDKKNLEILYRIIRDEESGDKARFQAAEAIAKLGDERILPKLWALLISVYADDRVTGIRAMGSLGTVQAKNALISKLDDDVLEVRLATAEQLGLLGDDVGQPEVLDVFTKNLTEDMEPADAERVKVLAAMAVSRIQTPELTKFLPQLLADDSKFVRLAAAQAALLASKN